MRLEEYRRLQLARFLRFLNEHYNLRFPYVMDWTNEGAEQRRYVMALVYLAQYFGTDIGYWFDAYSAGPVSSVMVSDLFRIKFVDEPLFPPAAFIRLLWDLGPSRDNVFICASYLYLRERGVSHGEAVSTLSGTYGRRKVEEVLQILRRYVG